MDFFFFFEKALDDSLLSEMKVYKLSSFSYVISQFSPILVSSIKHVTFLKAIHLYTVNKWWGRRHAGLTFITGSVPGPAPVPLNGGLYHLCDAVSSLEFVEVMTEVPSSFDRSDSVEGGVDVFLGFDFTQSTAYTHARKNALKKFQPWFGFLSLFFIEQAGSKMKSDSRYRHGNFLWFLWSLPII